jgi:hypothetical protein
MSAHQLRLSAGLGVLLAASVAASADDPPAASRRDADLLKQKVAAIARRGEEAQPSSKPLRTTVTENEVNAYLTHELADKLPTGVVSPSVSIRGGGRVSGRAVVDLDRVRQEQKATSIFNPISYLKGRLPVVGTGSVRTGNGVARFQFESASIAGVPIPKLLLQQIVAYYSRSEQYPSGIGLDDPFALPARIREIQVERGQAIVVQ